MASTSAWFRGCCGGSSSLSTPAVACGGTVEICDCMVVWGIRAPVNCEGPSIESSFSGFFLVAFRRCSLEHTNGGRQYWGSIPKGYRTPMRNERELSEKMVSGIESEVKRLTIRPPLGAREGLFIGEVKGLIIML
jgi:hypothetical protein